MTIYPPAKVNIHLEVLGKRDDGYHDIRSIFLRLKLCDQLTLSINEGNHFSLTHQPAVAWPAEHDILYKSYQAFSQLSGPLALSMHLTKHIPDKAGLGGGSSDAASLLLALNHYSGKLGDDQIFDISKKIGADLPFFMSGYTAAMVESTGDALEVLPFFKLYVVLLRPETLISTKDAFAALNTTDFTHQFSKATLREYWAKQNFNFINTFSKVLASKYCYIEEYKKELYGLGAKFAELSGTGSVVAGYFLDYKQAAIAYNLLKKDVPSIFLTETL